MVHPRARLAKADSTNKWTVTLVNGTTYCNVVTESEKVLTGRNLPGSKDQDASAKPFLIPLS
jgi:hypothetical protein